MSRKLPYIILTVLFSLLSLNTSAEKLVFVTADWPPYVFTEAGKLTGIHVEIVREASQRLGLEVEIESVPWARAVKQVKEGHATAIFSPKKNTEREVFLYFPTEPLGIEKNVIVTQQQSATALSSLEELKDKVIGVVRGYAYSQIFDDNQTLKKDVAKNDIQMLKKLEKKRADLAAGEESALRYIRKQLNLQEIKTIYVLSELPTYIAFSKSALGEKGEAFAEQFGQMLRQLKKEGFVQEIEQKYQKYL